MWLLFLSPEKPNVFCFQISLGGEEGQAVGSSLTVKTNIPGTS